MFAAQSNRTNTALELSFKSDPRYISRLSSLAGRIFPEADMKHWHSTGNALLLRDPTARRILIVNNQKLQLQTLAFDTITKRLDHHVKLIDLAANEFDLKQFENASFTAAGFLDIGMSHREMNDLMFGTYFRPSGVYSTVCEKALRLEPDHVWREERLPA